MYHLTVSSDKVVACVDGILQLCLATGEAFDKDQRGRCQEREEKEPVVGGNMSRRKVSRRCHRSHKCV